MRSVVLRETVELSCGALESFENRKLQSGAASASAMIAALTVRTTAPPPNPPYLQPLTHSCVDLGGPEAPCTSATTDVLTS